MDLKDGQLYENDELKIYRGNDFVISKYIKIHQATLGEICDYGEKYYYSMLYNLTATPQYLKSQLWDEGIDYTMITPYQLFCTFLFYMYPKEKTSILFGDLDLTKFQLRKREDDDSYYLCQDIYQGDIYDKNDIFLYHFSSLFDASDFLKWDIKTLFFVLNMGGINNDFVFKNIITEQIIIDEFTYNMITDYLCTSHLIERDFKVPANNSTKMVLIEDAKEELERNKNKEYHSQLKNLISSMVNIPGFKYDHTQVWNMKINAFMDSVKRIGKIKNADLLLQSGYSGFGVDLNKINKNQLDWLGELT